MSAFTNIYAADRLRNTGGGHALRYLRYLRSCQTSSGFLLLFYRFLLHRMTLKYGLEIPWNCKIGKGLYLGHAFNITINPAAEIGDYCNIHKGVTIGQINRGGKKGVPKIGNKV